MTYNIEYANSQIRVNSDFELDFAFYGTKFLAQVKKTYPVTFIPLKKNN